MVMTYDEFFAFVIGSGEPAAPASARPYAYQRQLATDQWPDVLNIPTGLGKTAAVTCAWMFRILSADQATPRRLIWCLPMRVLVDQVRNNVKTWLDRAAPYFEQALGVVPQCHVLMGGETDSDWVAHPEVPAVIVGTQDMLLSRALMRGYGCSRYQWPMDFALLHNDALWVFDEMQLMGTALFTSAQLEAFRRDPRIPTMLPARTLWSSATFDTRWLDTINFRPYVASVRVLRLSDHDQNDARVAQRFKASKRMARARAALQGNHRADWDSYCGQLCDEILQSHVGDGPTLVIINRVARAQEVYRRLRRTLDGRKQATQLLLIHARFRGRERAELNAALAGLRADNNVIIVATQAIEAGVDITSRRLFTELAPWSSLVQRFGRCNRGGEYDDAEVRWIDINVDADDRLALPYTAAAMEQARNRLLTLNSATPADLPPVDEPPAPTHVLRQKDFFDLFNTEPDLSGFDIDISPFLRDPGGADVQVFWREHASPPGDEPRAAIEELCPIPIGDLKAHLRSVKQSGYIWNALESRWDPLHDPEDVRPGQVVLLHANAGGYDSGLGFVAGLRGRVEPGATALTERVPDSMNDEANAAASSYVELGAHLLATKEKAAELARALPMGGAQDAVIKAALWHDVGKTHPAFQTAILAGADANVDRSRFYAKSPHARRRPNFAVMIEGALQQRRHFRHELASMLAWLQAGESPSGANDDEPGAGLTSDLIAYLIAAHHGKIRTSLRSLPGEVAPPNGRLFARGVWAGDELPEFSIDGLRIPPITLRLDLMQLGTGAMGPSWADRIAALLERWGPFRLAWLETMVRLADWRASAGHVAEVVG